MIIVWRIVALPPLSTFSMPPGPEALSTTWFRVEQRAAVAGVARRVRALDQKCRLVRHDRRGALAAVNEEVADHLAVGERGARAAPGEIEAGAPALGAVLPDRGAVGDNVGAVLRIDAATRRGRLVVTRSPNRGRPCSRVPARRRRRGRAPPSPDRRRRARACSRRGRCRHHAPRGSRSPRSRRRPRPCRRRCSRCRRRRTSPHRPERRCPTGAGSKPPAPRRTLPP